VTEPPEPRRPEEGGGEDDLDWAEMERNAARDFVRDHTPDMQDAINAAREEMGDEAFDAAVEEVLRRAHERQQDPGDPNPDAPFGDDDPIDWETWDDDVLLDQVGRGEERDEFDDTGELRDMLEAWRENVGSEPVPPIAERAQQIHEFTQEIESTTNIERTGHVPIADDAARLANLGTNGDRIQGLISSAEEGVRSAASALQEVSSLLNQLAGEAGQAAGGAEGDQLNGLGVTAAGTIENLLSAVAQFDPDEARGQVNAFFEAVRDAAQRHGG